MIARAKDGIHKPKFYHTRIINDSFEPSTYIQAMAHPFGLHEMQVEYDTLMHNNTWALTSLPSRENIVGCMWVFKWKYNVDSSLQIYKARLVAK